MLRTVIQQPQRRSVNRHADDEGFALPQLPQGRMASRCAFIVADKRKSWFGTSSDELTMLLRPAVRRELLHQCEETARREYLLPGEGDGDGIEYLLEVAYLRSGGTAGTTMVFSA